MANIITLDPLMENMRVLLQVFNKNKVVITNETLHSSILSGDANSTRLQQHYRGGVNWILKLNGGKNQRFPSDWVGMSVQQLAEYLISKQTA